MSEVKLYAERDLRGLDFAGNHYCKHILAMTKEGLHAKSDIAAELAFRDFELAALREELARVKGLDHNQLLAESAAQHLIKRGAENYTGEVFTIQLDDGATRFEVVVSTQKVGAITIYERLAAAEQRNAELEKDASRYVWLRDKSESVHQFYLSTPIWFTGVKFNPENVDSTIDAAMTKPTESGASECTPAK